jgi:hypothetical protein
MFSLVKTTYLPGFQPEFSNFFASPATLIGLTAAWLAFGQTQWRMWNARKMKLQYCRGDLEVIRARQAEYLSLARVIWIIHVISFTTQIYTGPRISTDIYRQVWAYSNKFRIYQT